MIGHKDLVHRFSYHQPRDEATKTKHSDVRNECFALATLLDRMLPDGREKALAITKIEEVMFWANAAIARDTDVLNIDYVMGADGQRVRI